MPETLNEIMDSMLEFVKGCGNELIKNQEETKTMSPVQLVQHLMELRDKFEKIVVEGFNNDKGFQKVLKDVSFRLYKSHFMMMMMMMMMLYCTLCIGLRILHEYRQSNCPIPLPLR